MMRCQLVEAAAALVTDAVLAEAIDRPALLAGFIADPRDVHHALAKIERRFDRVSQARPRRSAHHGTVDHDFDFVLAPMAQLGWAVEADRLAVDSHPCEAGCTQVVPERFVALTIAPFNRRHDVDPGALRQVQDFLDDLVSRLSADGHTAFRAERMP